jgi:hypothetical protein
MSSTSTRLATSKRTPSGLRHLPPPRRTALDRVLSRAVDRAIVQLEASDDPEIRAAWRKVLDDLEDLIPETET